jgi:hypothetical protein
MNLGGFMSTPAVMYPEARRYFQISFIGATALALPTCPVSAMPSSMVRSTL